MIDNKFAILFVCTGNTCRSPMAEGALRVLLEKERPGRFIVGSAGTGALEGASATEFAVEAARIWNADISDHVSRPLTEELVASADLIFTMTERHLRVVLDMVHDGGTKSYLLKNFPDPTPEGEGVDDPVGMSLDRYNETFLEIGEYLGLHLKEIVKRIDAVSVAK